MEFSDFLKKLREEKGYSVRELGLKSDVSFGQISKIENGKRGIPKPETIKKLADGLGADYEQMLHVAGYLTNEDVEDNTELMTFLKKANVTFRGRPLTKQDKQRIEDVLTGLFWDTRERVEHGDGEN